MIEFNSGPKVTNPINAMVEVAAFSNSTEGGLELFMNAACKTGELELNIKVMNPIMARPRRYSLVDADVAFNSSSLVGVDEGLDVVASIDGGIIFVSVEGFDNVFDFVPITPISVKLSRPLMKFLDEKVEVA
jgi:hypothetical protein